MSKPETRRRVTTRPFPWLLLLVFLATVYIFWVLPRQLGDHPVKVDFDPVGNPEPQAELRHAPN